jgi:hypothetical protein
MQRVGEFVLEPLHYVKAVTLAERRNLVDGGFVIVGYHTLYFF